MSNSARRKIVELYAKIEQLEAENAELKNSRGLRHIQSLRQQLAAEPIQAELENLRIKIAKDEFPASIGRAILQACGELPEGFDLHIECEYGAATVRLYLPDSDACMDDFGSDNTLAEEINNAVNVAISLGENHAKP